MAIALAAFNHALGNEDIGLELQDIQRECAHAADEHLLRWSLRLSVSLHSWPVLSSIVTLATGSANLHATMALSSICDFASMSGAVSVKTQ